MKTSDYNVFREIPVFLKLITKKQLFLHVLKNQYLSDNTQVAFY